MEDLVKRIRVFVASPADVSAERNQLPKVIQEINLVISAIAPEKKIVLDLIRWETNAYPGLGKDAQDVINKQLPAYDIFIGIMWKRFGTPTSVAGSGTEEEFNHAFSKWEQDNNFPVLFYFCQKLLAIPNSMEEIEQLKKVILFKESLSTKGLIWEYNDPADFADIMRPHLVMTLGKILTSHHHLPEKEETLAPLTSASDTEIIRQQLNGLKAEYERLRKEVPAGNERTRMMAVVESKMRSMALQLTTILPYLTSSTSPGERLAAIAALKEIPNADYVDWLANRIGVSESSFIGYNAALALLATVRNLGKSHKAQLEEALKKAFLNLEKAEYKDPNQVKVLKSAQLQIQTS